MEVNSYQLWILDGDRKWSVYGFFGCEDQALRHYREDYIEYHYPKGVIDFKIVKVTVIKDD